MKIKGVVLLSRRQFVKDHFGEDAWEKVLQALPAEDRAELEAIFAAKWYPFEIGKRVDQAIVDVLGAGQESVFEDLGVKSAQRNLEKEHWIFLAPGNPQAFMKKAGLIYRFYYDTGYREYEETGPNSGVMTTHEAESFSAPDCLTVIGWYKEALRRCGAKNVEVVEEECRARGGDCCRYVFSWEM
jgi:uncharacterized protein (TIGR02265 family)